MTVVPLPARRGDRTPPANLEAEESLLGAMLLSRDAIAAAVEAHVETTDFYKPAHGHIFEAVMVLYGQGEPVDPVTVSDELRRMKALDSLGGSAALARLVNATHATANAGHYGTIVRELALLRALIAVGGEVAEMGYDDTAEPRETLDRAEALVFKLAEREMSSETRTAREIVDAALAEIDSDQTDIIGVPTGYLEYDQLVLGLQPSALIVVAARPSCGKTAFALGAAGNIAVEAGRPTMFFSMEMSETELMKRLFASMARVDLRRMQRRSLTMNERDKLASVEQRIGNAPLQIVDNPHCTVMEVRALARRFRSKFGPLGAIFVDYIQLMSPTASRRPSENRQVEVSEMSRGLKILARELDCPVVALSQLNRNLEYRGDKRPMLADLRESGSIEQDADIVSFLYRDEIYNKDSQEKGVAEVITAKHRNGPTGTVKLGFLGAYTKFVNHAKES